MSKPTWYSTFHVPNRVGLIFGARSDTGHHQAQG